MTQRAGFNIPNYTSTEAGGIGDLAEPDSGDFSILGNHKNGVVRGCDFSYTGSTFSLTSADNLVVYNGEPQKISLPQSIGISDPVGGSQFTLVVWDGTKLAKIAGSADADNPVFPDLPTNVVVLAAVYKDGTNNKCVDKRLFLTPGAFAMLESGDFLSQRTPSALKFAVDYNGSIRWGDAGPNLYRIDGGMRLSSSLTVDGSASVNAGLTAYTGTFSEVVTASNIRRGSGLPSPSEGSPGDIYQRTNGQLYVRGSAAWQELPAGNLNPVGTVISNISDPSSPAAPQVSEGWLPMTGGTYNQSDYPDLWAAVPAGWKVGTTFTLPNMTQRTVIGASTGAGPGSLTGSNSVTLTTNQLPSHKHFAANQSVTTPNATVGEHRHAGVDGFTGGGFVYTDVASQGEGKIYAFVENATTTASVSFGRKESVPGFPAKGPTTPAGGHQHTIPLGSIESGSGSGASVNTTPASMAVYFYIRT